jgi:hypothetical protein
VALIQLYILVALGLGQAMEGYAPRYAPGLMQRVAARRGIEPAGRIAVSSAYYPLGTELWVWGVNTHVLRRAVIVDVSAQRDMARHRRTKRLIEIAHEDALALCGNMGRPTECPVIVFRLEE